MNPAPRLSVAIPVHNEEQVLPELLRRLRAVLDVIPGGPHQIVFADDGSTDFSLGLLEHAASEDSRIVVVALSRNYGHQAAITAALEYADGDATVVMDGDLQDLPEAIPQFLERFAEGYDVVYGRRIRRKEPLLLRACFAGARRHFAPHRSRLADALDESRRDESPSHSLPPRNALSPVATSGL